MKTRALGAVCALAAIGGLQWDAGAAQVNSAGTIFQMHDAPGAPIPTIVYQFGTALNYSATVATMSAAIPRAPGGGAVTVFVDGLAVTGTYSCTVMSRGVTTIFATRSFSVSSVAVNWTRSVNFNAPDVPSGAYLSVSCSVPSDGGFLGVTATG